MAVLRQTNWLGQWRVDVPHLRAVESAVAGDFDLLAGWIMAGGSPLIVKGFAVSMTNAISAAASNLRVTVAGSVLIHYGASESGSIFQVDSAAASEQLVGTNSKVVGSFTPSATNYVGLDLVRVADTASVDEVQFLDDDSGEETPQSVPLARALEYRFVISPNAFNTNSAVAPIAKVVTDASNNVVSVTDSRNMFWRLGSGGDSPNAANKFPWATRAEVALTSTSSLVDPFTGGDRQLTSLKGWADAVMTRLWEIGGGEYWYSASTPINVKLVRQPSNVFASSQDNFEWVSSNLHWKGLRVVFDNSTAYYNTVQDQLTDSAGKTDLAVGECLYVDLNRSSNGATVIAAKATLATLSAPVTPGSRIVLAWRTNEGIYSREQAFQVGTAVAPASTSSLGVVKIATAAADAANPIVPVVGTDTKVTAAGISRSSAGGASVAGGVLTIGGGANDQGVLIQPASSHGITLMGARLAGAADIDVTIDTVATRTTGDILNIKNNGAQIARIDYAGNLVQMVAGSRIIQQGSNSSLLFEGNRDAADADTDVVVRSTLTRTQGSLFGVQNNGTNRFRVSYDGSLDLDTSGEGSWISQRTANGNLVLRGNKSGADAGTDVIVRSTAVRTNGYVLDVQNETTSNFAVDYSGALLLQRSTSAIRATVANISLLLKGNRSAADTGADVVLASQAVRTNGLLLDVQNQSGSRFSVEYDGTTNWPASALLRAMGVNGSIQVRGNRSAADTGTDVVLNSTATRTNGSLLDVQNNAVSKMSVDYAGNMTLAGRVTALGTETLVVKTADQSETAGTLTDVTDLSFSVTSGNTYEFEFVLSTETAPDATRPYPTFSVTGPTTTKAIVWAERVAALDSDSGNAMSIQLFKTLGDAYLFTPTSWESSASAASGIRVIKGYVVPSANGTIQLRFKATSGLDTTVKAGSFVRYVKVN